MNYIEVEKLIKQASAPMSYAEFCAMNKEAGITDTLNTVGKAIGTAGKYVGKVVNRINPVTNAINGAKQLYGLGQKAVGAYNKFQADPEGTLKNLGARAGRAYGSAVNTLGNGMYNTYAAGQKAVNATANTAKNVANQTAATAKNVANQATSAAKNVATQAGNAANAAGKAVGNAYGQTVNALGNGMYNIYRGGQAFTNGLREGYNQAM